MLNSVENMWKKYLVLILLSFMLVEICCRGWLYFYASNLDKLYFSSYYDIKESSMQWSSHPHLGYYPTPFYRKNKTSHNSLGFRGEEIFQKKKGTTRIVALGGSTTYTEAVKDDKFSYPHLLQRYLNENSDAGYEVINAGVSAYSSTESLINLQLRVLELNPDIIIIYHGVNDVHARLVDPEHYLADNTGRRKSWEKPEYSIFDESMYLRMMRRKIGFSRPPFLGDLVNSPYFKGAGTYYFEKHKENVDFYNNLLDKNRPIYFRRNLNLMVNIARQNNIEPLLLTWAYTKKLPGYTDFSYYQKALSEMNEVVKEVASINNVRILDFANLMSEDKKYWADSRHVNEEGSKLKAQIIGKWILEQMRSDG